MSLVSLYDAASLWMTPSGAEDGKLFSQLPTDGSGDFTFSRGSNLAATRVGADGLIEKGRENLILQSNNFDTTWTGTSGVSVTSGESGYNGSNDAWLLSKSVAEQYSRVQQNVNSSGIYTCSVYAKENTISIVGLRNGSSSDRVLFDLSGSGSIDSQVGNIVNRKIQSVGNGWFRCEVTFSNALDQFQIYVDWSDNVAGSIYIQDAQLEIGLAATDVIETGATTGKAGLLEDEPRFDYSGGATCPSLLLEPSRTQLVPYTEYANAVAGSLATITDNVTTSPEGVQNAARFLPTSAFGRWQSEIFGGSVTNGTTYVASAYFNTSSTLEIVTFYIGWNAVTGTDRIGIKFNPNTRAYISTYSEGSATLTDYEIGEADENGWYRVSLIAPASNANANTCLVLRDLNSQADGSKYVDFYGWQMEQGSYPTSYIPNHSGGSVTRGAESLSKYDFTDSTSKTLFIECGDTGYAGGSGEIILEKTNPVAAIFRIYIETNNSGTNVSSIRLRTEFPVNNYDFNLGNKDEFKKIALSINGSNVKIFGNGSLLGTYVVTPTTMEQLNWRVQSTKYSTKQFLLFPTALTDSECIALTIDGLKEDIIASYKTRATTLESGAEDRLDTYLQELEDFIIV
jgi:hypothetical protein